MNVSVKIEKQIYSTLYFTVGAEARCMNNKTTILW